MSNLQNALEKGKNKNTDMISYITALLERNNHKYDTHQLETLLRHLEHKKMVKQKAAFVQRKDFQNFMKARGVKNNKTLSNSDKDELILDHIEGRMEKGENNAHLWDLHDHVSVGILNKDIDDKIRNNKEYSKSKTAYNPISDKVSAIDHFLSLEDNLLAQHGFDRRQLGILHDKTVYNKSMELEKKMETLLKKEKEARNAKNINAAVKAKMMYRELFEDLKSIELENATNDEEEQEQEEVGGNIPSNANAKKVNAKVKQRKLQDFMKRLASLTEEIEMLLHEYENFEIEQYRNQNRENRYKENLLTDIYNQRRNINNRNSPLYKFYNKYRQGLPQNKTKWRMIHAQIQLHHLDDLIRGNIAQVEDFFMLADKGKADLGEQLYSQVEGYKKRLDAALVKKAKLDTMYKERLNAFLKNERVVNYKMGPKRDIYSDALDAYIEHHGKDYSNEKREKTLNKFRREGEIYREKYGYNGDEWKYHYVAERIKHPLAEGMKVYKPISKEYNANPVLQI